MLTGPVIFQVIDDPLDDKLYMIIEYVEGGPVWGRSHQDPLPEHLARKYFQDVVRGLDYLHRHKVSDALAVSNETSISSIFAVLCTSCSCF